MVEVPRRHAIGWCHVTGQPHGRLEIPSSHLGWTAARSRPPSAPTSPAAPARDTTTGRPAQLVQDQLTPHPSLAGLASRTPGPRRIVLGQPARSAVVGVRHDRHQPLGGEPALDRFRLLAVWLGKEQHPGAPAVVRPPPFQNKAWISATSHSSSYTSAQRLATFMMRGDLSMTG